MSARVLLFIAFGIVEVAAQIFASDARATVAHEPSPHLSPHLSPGLRSFTTQPLSLFEIEKGHLAPDRLRIETKKVDGANVEVLSHFVKNRLDRQLPILSSVRTKLLADFEAALSPKKRARLQVAGACGETLFIRFQLTNEKRVRSETLCLDLLPVAQQTALIHWWREAERVLTP